MDNNLISVFRGSLHHLSHHACKKQPLRFQSELIPRAGAPQYQVEVCQRSSSFSCLEWPGSRMVLPLQKLDSFQGKNSESEMPTFHSGSAQYPKHARTMQIFANVQISYNVSHHALLKEDVNLFNLYQFMSRFGAISTSPRREKLWHC